MEGGGGVFAGGGAICEFVAGVVAGVVGVGVGVGVVGVGVGTGGTVPGVVAGGTGAVATMGGAPLCNAAISLNEGKSAIAL